MGGPVDLVLVGGGAVGLAAAAEAARRGLSAVVLERRAFRHDESASGGASRQFHISTTTPRCPGWYSRPCRSDPVAHPGSGYGVRGADPLRQPPGGRDRARHRGVGSLADVLPRFGEGVCTRSSEVVERRIATLDAEIARLTALRDKLSAVVSAP